MAARWGENAEDSEVTFELKPEGREVLLTVTHRRLPDRDMLVSVAGGWHIHLEILADHLNGRVPPPFAQGLVREFRVRWALEEAGLAYEERLIGSEDQKSKTYRRLQPFGQVPAYEEDGLRINGQRTRPALE